MTRFSKLLKSILKLLGILLLIIIILGHNDIGNQYKSDQPDFKYLSIDENQIRYNQMGEGKDLLFIHGTPGSLEDWSTIRDRLAHKYRVTSYDRLGHGYSTQSGYNYCLKDNADLAKQIIDKLNLEEPMIIGHSYGGSTVAHLLSTHYNDRLRYMIIDAPLFDYNASFTYKLLSLPIIGKPITFIANYTIAEGMIESGVKAAVSNQSSKDLEDIVKLRKDIWLQPKILYSKALESVNYKHDLNKQAPAYKNIKASVTIVTGQNSEKTYLEEAQRFSNSVSTDTLVVLKNTGHYIQLDQEEAIISLIKEKLEQ